MKDYSLVILHQLPSTKNSISGFIRDIKELSIPVLLIVGQQSNINNTKQLLGDNGFRSAVRSFENSTAIINQKFPLFSLAGIDYSLVEALPPLTVPLGNYKNINPSNVLVWQKINRIKTDFPLIYFSSVDNHKIGIIMGEGIWRWRTYNYLEKYNFSVFDDLIGKTIQYLTVKLDKRQFIVRSKGEYDFNEAIVLEAELYNKSYEFINDAEIDLKLTNEKGEAFAYVFNSNKDSYKLKLDLEESGIYSYKANSNYKGEEYTAKGEFVVIQKNYEAQQLIANYGLMYNISKINDGEIFSLNEFSKFNKRIKSKAPKNRISYSYTYTGLNNIPLILSLIILLLTLEWVLRKYLGSY